MKKFRICNLLIAFALVLSMLVPAGASNLADVSNIVKKKTVDAEAALLANMTHDVIYYEQNARTKVYPASITKVMTALLVVEAIEDGTWTLDTEVTAGGETWLGIPSDGSTANIQIGETMTVENLLYCLMLPSANEAANILAQALSGSVADFVARMNDRAVELGCTMTHFENPHGIHSDNHYTSCYDLYLIACEAMSNEIFRTIVSTDAYTVPPTNMSEERPLANTNALLTGKKYSGYVMEDCIGIKTGSTDAAGYCLLSAAERDGNILISVVMGAETTLDRDGTHRKQFSESSSLLEWGFEYFSIHPILESSDPVAEVPVTLGVDVDSVLVVPAESIDALLPEDVHGDAFTTKAEVVETVEAPVEKGQVLGSLTIYLQDQPYGTVDLVAVETVEQDVFLARLKAIEDFVSNAWFKMAVGLVLLVALIVVLRMTVFQPKRRYGSRYTGSRRSSMGPSYKGTRRRR
ncbi:MAG: D-alanyl-D-alanine carboxypeptidase [Oscillospiraceae bacterium]|nr:D-alanyl-D-alanine carboxypeptidase [Oscillospiraceae bacterium]